MKNILAALHDVSKTQQQKLLKITKKKEFNHFRMEIVNCN
ncbi:hypothetical protein SAMN02746042_00391 [Fructilactobacillus lindneri DSM 20690 = JCM 11027]|nr:hypothetical protein SAMN02746042_00391 [Fructilactobacillus lindneri DSM 20690 = JCM 11027]